MKSSTAMIVRPLDVAKIEEPSKSWYDTIREGVSGATQWVSGTALPTTQSGATSAYGYAKGAASTLVDTACDMTNAVGEGWTKGRKDSK